MSGRVRSAQWQRNGVSGTGFYAAIVDDPFSWRRREHPVESGRFLVISLDDEHGGASRENTFVISMADLHKGELVNKWRGDCVDPAILGEIRQAAGL